MNNAQWETLIKHVKQHPKEFENYVVNELKKVEKDSEKKSPH